MSLHPFDKLSLNDGGALILTPCPGTKGVSLRDSLAQLAQPDACNELGLKWFHFPIEDDTAPGEAFMQAWENDKQQVFDILNQQGTIAIHCKGGSGRTGLMVAIILLERGMPSEQVVAQVKSLRPNALKLAVHTDYLAQTYIE